jgi:hypothetical protein
MAASSLYEKASIFFVPSGYKDGKIYPQKPTNGSGDLDFTRASAATRVNAQGLIESVASGVPRLDYTGGGCPSLLLEPQRTNLLTWSEDFTNVNWGKLNVTVSGNVAEAPDGTTTADLIYPTTSGTNRVVEQFFVSSPGLTFTNSFFVKSAGFDWVYVQAPSLGACWFNLSTGEFGTIAAGVTARVISENNGYYRLAFTQTLGSSIAYAPIGVSDANGSTTATTSGTNGIHIWGAQLEEGSYPTSYIPTTSAAVTRLADAASKTGISSLIGQAEGVIYFEGQIKDIPLNVTIFGIENAATSSVIRFHFDALGQFKAQCFNGVSNLFFENGPAIQINTTYKFAFAYKESDYAFYVNGNLIATGSNSSAIPSCNALETNSLWGTLGSTFYSINTGALYPVRLSNSELQSLTSL